jgi:transcriptional regulator with XRE-family HTH domain
MAKNDRQSLIGERLAELRETLAADDPQSNWTQRKVASELGVSQNIIARLEKGLGSIDSLILLIWFYHSKGYSMHWLFVEDNSAASKYRKDEEGRNTAVALQKLMQLDGTLKSIIQDLQD